MGKIYIVATPIGNLDDMSPRAISVLNRVDLILAEDTRTSGVLLKHFDIKTPVLSHHKYNEHQTVERFLDRVESGENIALISDAGTPGISDPGFLLSREARLRGIEVETLPGPVAFVPALVNSGLPCDRFFFEGFLPHKKGRQTRLKFLSDIDVTFILYESPMRIIRTLRDLIEHCGEDRKASISREISKLHEETVRGTLGEIFKHYETNSPRGEFVIIIDGKSHKKGFNKEEEI